MMFLLVLLFAGLVLGGEGRGNKRNTDLDAPRGRIPVVAGGGMLLSKTGKSVPVERSGGNEGETLELLDTTPVPESYIFLLDERYAMCYPNLNFGQGSCNSCWAFATQKMLQARKCKWRSDDGETFPLQLLSPLNLICKVQEGSEVCSPRSIVDALEYTKDVGIIKQSRVLSWMWGPILTSSIFGASSNDFPASPLRRDHHAPPKRNFLNPVSETSILRDSSAANKMFYGPSLDGFDPKAQRLSTRLRIADISRPTDDNCRTFSELRLGPEHFAKAVKVFASAPPHTRDSLRRYLLRGPVIATIRLSWQFLVHKKALFHPKEPQTFCRMYKVGDPDDFCDPRKSDRWDQEQRNQQVRPAGMSNDEYMETWYNHFVTLHGYGVTPEGVKYWVVENSWGRMYENDPALGNNGAGSAFFVTELSDGHLNEFTLVADEVAGARGLEMTSREVYFASR